MKNKKLIIIITFLIVVSGMYGCGNIRGNLFGFLHSAVDENSSVGAIISEGDSRMAIALSKTGAEQDAAYLDAAGLYKMAYDKETNNVAALSGWTTALIMANNLDLGSSLSSLFGEEPLDLFPNPANTSSTDVNQIISNYEKLMRISFEYGESSATLFNLGYFEATSTYLHFIENPFIEHDGSGDYNIVIETTSIAISEFVKISSGPLLLNYFLKLDTGSIITECDIAIAGFESATNYMYLGGGSKLPNLMNGINTGFLVLVNLLKSVKTFLGG